MTRPMVRIHDLSNDSITDREMNDAEFAAYEAQQAVEAARQAEADAATAAKAALLKKLGISEDEAKLLIS